MKKKGELSASSEDYLEAIYLICRQNGKARAKEIKGRLGVSGPSVTEALQLLRHKGLVDYEPYQPITLTKEGEAAAREIFFKHSTLRDFFIQVLGLDQETADNGACALEHAVSPSITARMVQYSKFLREHCSAENSGEGLGCFVEYLKKLNGTIEE